jgi:membrane protein implicated in regulation of membrane protease activity
MEALSCLGYLAILIVGLLFVLLILSVGGFFLFTLWPLVLGILGVPLLWKYVDDNVAVVFGLVAIATQVWWSMRLGRGSSSGSSWEEGKKKHYDTKGKVVGYEDR